MMPDTKRFLLVMRIAIGLVVVVSSVLIHIHLGLPLLNAGYETGRLFLLEANTALGADSSWLTRTVLWTVRTAAPIITAAAFVELLMALGVFGAIPFYWRRHFVVAGAGRLGLELCLALRERGERVVAVEVDEHNANLSTLRHHGVRVLTGDATHDVLSSARLHHARGLLAVTREDLVNLNIGCKAVELAQQKRPGESSFRSYVHIYDPQLKATLESAFVEANDKKLCNLWLMNSYDMAASAVVRRLELVHESPTLLIIIGFGRMGQSVLHKVLCPETGSAPLTIRVVDPTFSAADTKIFHKLQSETSQSIERVAIDMRDPALWDQLEPEIQKSEEVRVLVCTDDDVGNLTFAFSMRDHCRRHQRLAVYIRLFKPLELLDRVLVFDGSGDDNQIRIERMYTWQLMMEGLPPELEELLNGG